ncbi:DNA-directed DNA polymerase II small subunit [Methanimicrococcus blatticola]|uniref:DNA polymerase II small subunit n=1 Tax=Methanimicrococcus blatticola TaxID=91560 RepID=A0A484F489_9EURY|nr:DNA-directed DNA polymerase II small subunit [Methanimicrococcus blatticola]MBZ3936359.1 DNA-directed DNA polymerase II small subunit [Methanimicrococcus blatticola]MCC2509521.1 DNA-directed DNA polymerase II small subunit [Methanimicrococcus blatticola]TDQ67574.1 DNA polymerase II small subunit [Methanimicrococcus blatticola]
MDETIILEKASEAGFMINKEAVDYLIGCRLQEDCLPRIFSEIDASVFVIETEHLTVLVQTLEKEAEATKTAEESKETAALPYKYSFDENMVDVLEDISEKTTSVGEYNQFVQYFRDRYTRISEMIRSRVSARPIESLPKGKNVKPLSREGNSDITIIGMISEKTTTGNQHIILTLEDPTGTFPVLINQRDTDLVEQADKLLLDEIVGITGNLTPEGTILMASKITQPDVPNNYSSNRRRSEGYALFISDVHVGSKEFMKNEWETFLDFLNGKSENPQLQKMASEIRYIIVAGDIVDGIGIYPGQEFDLEIPEIMRQYEVTAEYFHRIPKNIHVVISPGNHDAVRRAEPQITFSKEIQRLFPENVTFVGNPAVISIDGVCVHIYHGCSMDDMVAAIKGVSYQEPTSGMVEMVKRRHLAPTYGSRVMISPEKRDYLIIDKVPDIIHCGHVHTIGVQNYKNILLINSGTWQAQTDFQKKVNIMPDPAKVPFVDLKTMKPGILDFNDDY